MVQEKKQHDEQRQQALAQQVELLNSQLETAKEEVHIDGLTKVHNRRAFDRYIEDEFQRSHITGQAFGLMLFDIDDFKRINDTHGHQIGDRLLSAVSQEAKNCLRTDDFVARYDGDEFAIVLRGNSLSDASNVLERFRKSVSRGFRYKKDEGADQVIETTISGGIAWFRESDTAESLIERADQTLYLAKQRGRNKVCTEEDLESSE